MKITNAVRCGSQCGEAMFTGVCCLRGEVRLKQTSFSSLARSGTSVFGPVGVPRGETSHRLHPYQSNLF